MAAADGAAFRVKKLPFVESPARDLPSRDLTHKAGCRVALAVQLAEAAADASRDMLPAADLLELRRRQPR